MAAPDDPTHSIIDASPNASTGIHFPSTQSPATQRYVLGDEIARGGMGIICRATDTVLGREVAVKVLQEKYSPESGAAVRFFGEARITGQLQHPSIPPVHDLGMLADGRPFLAMKLIKGQTLQVQLEARPDPSAERGRFMAVFEQICQALAYAHSRDVLHRDLKPANVMVGAFGEVHVMDWGLAKVLGAEALPAATETAGEVTRALTQISPTPDAGSHTQAGSMLGTPAYAPPEQVAGEIEKVDVRADVFGLGAILAVILTGKPPYVGETAESVRVMALRGKLIDCFVRLDGCGAEPELVALCKRCLAFEPADRPADAGEVAKAVAGLRAAANERAREAELERVRVEGERATSEAQAAERRMRRRLWLGAAAYVAVAAVGGLTAVVVLQRRAHAELAAEQAKVEARNKELAAEQAKVQARFDMAVKAIETFHTGVSQDTLLKNEQFKELRTKLLKEAAGFYADLEKLLAGQTDPRSRKALAAGYFQLAELTFKIGSQPEGLAIHRKALAIRRELAAAAGADVETRLDVVRSLRKLGTASGSMSDYAAALAAYGEGRDLAERLAAESPTDAVRFMLAGTYDVIGWVLRLTGRPAEALAAQEKALAILQELADANPDNSEFQFQLAMIHNNIGHALRTSAKSAEALAAHGKALAVMRTLVTAHPANADFHMHVAGSHNNIGLVLTQMGRPAEALAAQTEALAIRQNLVDAHPAVTEFQDDLRWCYDQIGILLLQTGKVADALATHGKALGIVQKLADANPANTSAKLDLACSHCYVGRVLARLRRFPEAFTALDTGLALNRKLVEGDAENANYRSSLACSYAYRGGARVRAGQPAPAAADLRRAVELWARVPPLDTAHIFAFDSRFELSRALALLAELGNDAQSGVTTAEAAAFADQAVVALRDAINAGWNGPIELKEPDFDTVRGRADFQKLVAAVEGKAEK